MSASRSGSTGIFGSSGRNRLGICFNLAAWKYGRCLEYRCYHGTGTRNLKTGSSCGCLCRRHINQTCRRCRNRTRTVTRSNSGSYGFRCYRYSFSTGSFRSSYCGPTDRFRSRSFSYCACDARGRLS